MFRTDFALAAGLCLVLTTVSVSAQGPSYESRGYGGPLYVGPNFQQGGQWSPPSYGPKSSSQERATTKRARSTAKSRKAPAEQEANTDKASPVAEDSSNENENSAIAGGPISADKANAAAESENSTISSASLQADTTDAETDAEPGPKAEAAAASPATCKRFIAAAGKTVTVPCD